MGEKLKKLSQPSINFCNKKHRSQREATKGGVRLESKKKRRTGGGGGGEEGRGSR